MKKIIAILVLCLTTSASFAQDVNEDYKSKANSELEYVKRTVKLTVDQEKKLYELYYKIQQVAGDIALSSEVKGIKIKDLEDKAKKIVESAKAK
nr:hypothetical protein [uncultured Flavobacterium sp.]